MNPDFPEHYKFEKYVQQDRWASFYYQMRTLLQLQPKEVLEIGVGNGVLREMSRLFGLTHLTMDISEHLKPDLVGSIESIPASDSSYDLVCAFEVLEHLPFDKFEPSLIELRRVARKYVVLSLPHYGPSLRFLIKVPLLKERKFAWKIPHHPVHPSGGEHYWEIGKKGYSAARILSILQNHFTVMNDFVPFENQYHHFYILKK